MTKLFGAVVGAISFFKTRPVDKAKVNQNKIRIDSDFVLLSYKTYGISNGVCMVNSAWHRLTTVCFVCTTTSLWASSSWPLPCSGFYSHYLEFNLTIGIGCCSLNELLGDAIMCRGLENGKVNDAPKAVTQFCWVSGMYTGEQLYANNKKIPQLRSSSAK